VPNRPWCTFPVFEDYGGLDALERCMDWAVTGAFPG
jgi:hypothetical protein